MVGTDAYDPAEASHRALRGIQRELERHPTISSVRGFPSGTYTHVVANVAVARIDLDLEDATLTVHWFAGETPSEPPGFKFHYSDATGDFGWYYHPQDHVDSRGHVQKRSADETTYTYDSYTFASMNPTRVVWEVMSRLTTTVQIE